MTHLRNLFRLPHHLYADEVLLTCAGKSFSGRQLAGGAVKKANAFPALRQPFSASALVLCTSEALLVEQVLAAVEGGYAVLVVDPRVGETQLQAYLREFTPQLALVECGLFPGVFCDCTTIGPAGEANAFVLNERQAGQPLPVLTLAGRNPEKSPHWSFSVESLAGLFTELDCVYGLAGRETVLMDRELPFREKTTELLWAISRDIPVAVASLGAATVSGVELAGPGDFPMDFSLFFFGSSTASGPAAPYKLLLETACFADTRGFRAVWTPERHFNAFGGLFPNPSVVGAALAATTRNLRIMSGSLVAPLHSTVRIAEDWSVLDNLSGGRTGISFASGWQCDDFVLNPAAYSDRHAHMLQQIKELGALWGGGSYRGRNGKGEETEVRLYPGPLQPKLPIWVTVSGKTESFVDAGTLGAHVLTHLLWQDPSELIEKIAAYRQARADSDLDPATGKVTVMVHTLMGETDQQVKEKVAAPLKAYIKSSVHLVEAMSRSYRAETRNQVGRYGNLDGHLSEELLEDLLEIAFERFYAQAALLGTPEKCHRLLERLAGYGVNEVACLIDFGLEAPDVMQGLEWLNRFKATYDYRASAKVAPAVCRLSTDRYRELGNAHPAMLTQHLKAVVLDAVAHPDESPATRVMLRRLRYRTGDAPGRPGTVHADCLVAAPAVEKLNQAIAEDF